MHKTKVGIVEDDMVIALGVTQILADLGYDVTEPANNYTEAIQMITGEKPDILLLDIQLSGSKDGIDVAHVVRRDYSIPFIFLTANDDIATIERAKNTGPDAYLVKPYRKSELFAAIELSLYNFSRSDKSASAAPVGADHYKVKDAIFIKQGQYFHKVKLDEILYLESNNNYVQVHTLKNKLLVRNNIGDYLELIGQPQFCRVHRSYAVNINQVQVINSEYLLINNIQIPIAKAYRDQLLAYLNLG